MEWACLVVKLRVAVRWSGGFSVRWVGSSNSCECKVVGGGNHGWLCGGVVTLRLWWTADGGCAQECRGFAESIIMEGVGACPGGGGGEAGVRVGQGGGCFALEDFSGDEDAWALHTESQCMRCGKCGKQSVRRVVSAEVIRRAQREMRDLVRVWSVWPVPLGGLGSVRYRLVGVGGVWLCFCVCLVPLLGMGVCAFGSCEDVCMVVFGWLKSLGEPPKG